MCVGLILLILLLQLLKRLQFRSPYIIIIDAVLLERTLNI